MTELQLLSGIFYRPKAVFQKLPSDKITLLTAVNCLLYFMANLSHPLPGGMRPPQNKLVLILITYPMVLWLSGLFNYILALILGRKPTYRWCINLKGISVVPYLVAHFILILCDMSVAIPQQDVTLFLATSFVYFILFLYVTGLNIYGVLSLPKGEVIQPQPVSGDSLTPPA